MAVLVRWEPWRMAGELEREVDLPLRRDLDPWLGMPWRWALALRGEGRWVPACDVFARGDDLVIRMELPGLDPATDIRVTVRDGVLYISGERGHDAAIEQAGYYRRESAHGAFERGVPLPEGVKAEDLTASYDNGVLEVVIPRGAEAPQPMRIPVHAGNGKKAVTAGEAKS